MAVVYRHIRLDKNEPFYIGIGKTEKRAYNKSGRNKIWKNIVAKTDYRIEILFDDLNREEAIEKELEFISMYGRINNSTGSLSNLTDGGDNFGKTPWNKGIKYDQNKIELMRQIAINNGSKPPSRKGIEDTLETKIKKSQSIKNSYEIRKNPNYQKIWITNGNENKLVDKLLFLPNGWYEGRKFENGQKGKTANNAKSIIINDISYKSVTDAANELGLSRSKITERIKSNDLKFINWNYQTEKI